MSVDRGLWNKTILFHISNQIKDVNAFTASGSRMDKIFPPVRDERIFFFFLRDVFFRDTSLIACRYRFNFLIILFSVVKFFLKKFEKTSAMQLICCLSSCNIKPERRFGFSEQINDSTSTNRGVRGCLVMVQAACHQS